MSIFTRHQQMGLASIILASSILLSRFMGLIRFKVISYFYGATPETDIYFAAFVIPDFINYLLAGGYFSITLIPLLSKAFEANEEDAWNFYSAIFNWVSIAIITVSALAWVFAPELTALTAPGFSPADNAKLAHFTRIILPAQVFFLPGAVFTALLYLRKQFIAPALTPLIYNGGIIIGGLGSYYIAPEAGMEGFCWGVVAGSALGSLALPYFAAKSGGLKLNFNLKHPLLKRFVILALPLMLGQSIVALDEQMLRIFGSLLSQGSVSILSYAQKVMQVPVAVLAQAAGAASYPFLASLAAAGKSKEKEFSATLAKSIQNTFALLTPSAVLMMITAEQIIRIIFEQGAFNNTQECAKLLQIMLIAVPFWGMQQLLGRAFYSKQDTLTPVILGTITTALSLVVYWQASLHYGAVGIAWATCFALFVYTGALIWRWIYKFGADAIYPTLKNNCKSLISSLLSALPAYLVFMQLTKHGFFNEIIGSIITIAFLQLCLTSLVFVAFHLLINKLLGLPFLPALVLRKK